MPSVGVRGEVRVNRVAVGRVCASDDVVAWLEKRGFPVHRCRTCSNAFVPEDLNFGDAMLVATRRPGPSA